MKQNRSNYEKMSARAMQTALAHRKQLQQRGIVVLDELVIESVLPNQEYKIQINTYDYLKIVIESKTNIRMTIEKV